MKKSFILHIDSLSILDELNDEQSGKLFKAIYNYQSGVESELDIITKIAFASFKAQFIRDDEQYDNVCEGKSLRGKIGNLKRWHSDLFEQLATDNSNIDELIEIAKHRTSDISESQTSLSIPKSLDSKSDSKSDSNNDNDSKIKNKKDNNKSKHLFSDSIYMNKHKFKDALTDWNSEKLKYYYESLLTWSNEGNKKIDWIATARQWASRDEREGKVKFDSKSKTTLPDWRSGKVTLTHEQYMTLTELQKRDYNQIIMGI